MLFNLSADACGIGTFCTDGFPEAENSAMQHIRDCAILDLHKLVCPKKLEVFMATRTICFPISGYPYCREQPVTFTWIKGSKRQNIRAVHDAVHTTDPDVSILEVSSASVQPEGEAVSSLRLLLHLDSVAQDVPISTVFEATKVFEHGGPFADLLTCEPPKVHKDTRLRTSGELLRYSLEGNEYPTEPYMDSFFEWLYCRALKQFPEKAEPLSRYNAFSDIAAAADSKKYYGDSSRAAAIYVGLAAAGKLSCIDSYELFIAEVYTEPKPLPKSGKSEAASKMTPEVSAPAKETPADELPQPDNANAEVIPDAAQMEHILELPKATCLLLSLAKNAGLSANSSSELTYKGKEFLLDAYQIALKNKTLQINIQKNKITFPMEEPDSGFHAVGVLTRSPAWEYGWKFNYLTENTSGAEKSEVKEKIPPKPLTALEHLERCGYRIVQQVVPKKLPPIAVQRMAWKTGEALCDPVVVDFLQFIRTHMQSDGSFSFRIPKGTSKNSFATLSEIAQTWDKMGLFASIVIYPQNIVYELAQNETVRHFLSGKWLELFVEHLIPCLSVLWVECFFLGEQSRILCIQVFHFGQLFQAGFIESGFRRLMQRDFFPVRFQKFGAVPGFAVSIVYRPGLGIVDDVRPEDGDFCHTLLGGLDGIAQFVIARKCSISTLFQVIRTADFLLLQKNQRFGHLFQVVLLRPAFVAATFALGKFCLNVNQQLERLLFGRLLLMWAVFGFSGNDCFDFILAVPGTQCLEPDKAFLPCAFNGSVFAAFDFIALLFQLLQKIFVVGGLLLQNLVDYTAQPVAVALLWLVSDALLPFPVRLLFND